VTETNRHLALATILALVTLGCSDPSDDDSAPAGDDDTAGDDDDSAPGPPGFAIDGPLDTITRLQFTPELAGTGLPDEDLEVAWDFGDGDTLDFGPPAMVEHQYIHLGAYEITMTYQAAGGGEPQGSPAEVVIIGHPDAWPRILPTYYIGGFTQDPVDAMAADPRNVRAVMLAAFDVYDTVTTLVDTDLIDTLHAAGLLVYVDVAQWNEPWTSWEQLHDILLEMAEGGIDGVDFDEFGAAGALQADELNLLQEDLRDVNPHIRLMVTQIYLSQLDALLSAGGTPDYVALEWYLAGFNRFDETAAKAEEYGVRLAYWVDPSTYHQIPTTYEQADCVVLWNLCWNAATCGGEYETNTWVPWEDVVTHLEGLGEGLESAG